MDKSPEAFRTISEVAEALDVPPHVLRFWETRFAQVKPVKRGGGRRYYRPEDVRLLRGIRGLLYDDGMTIKGVQKILRERGIRHVIGLGTLPGRRAEPAAGAAAPRPRRARRRRGRGGGRAAGRPAAPISSRRPAPRRPGGGGRRRRRRRRAAKPIDKPALRALVAELEALRARWSPIPEGAAPSAPAIGHPDRALDERAEPPGATETCFRRLRSPRLAHRRVHHGPGLRIVFRTNTPEASRNAMAAVLLFSTSRGTMI